MFIFSEKEQVLSLNCFEFKYILKKRKYDTNHLIVVFSGFGAKSQFTYDFKRALESSRAHVLWIKDDFYNNDIATYYLDPISESSCILEESIFEFISKCIDFLNIKKKNCTLLGCSKGGAAALYYGLKYDFKNIVVSAPPLRIGSSVAGLIPKSAVKKTAKFLLGEKFTLDNVKEMDEKLLALLKNDEIYDKNIYLISSNGDPRFKGQIEPYLYLFNKYFNFNFIQSASVLVRSHQDVTSYNTPLILGILNCLTFNLIPECKNSIIKGDELNINYKFKAESVCDIRELKFNELGYFFIEGVYFIRGVECAEYGDLSYSLSFYSDDVEIYRTSLAKGNNKYISRDYYEGRFVNYDKSFICTKNNKGLNMDNAPYGRYALRVNIVMSSGEKDQQLLKFHNKINFVFTHDEYFHCLQTDEFGQVFYIKEQLN